MHNESLCRKRRRSAPGDTANLSRHQIIEIFKYFSVHFDQGSEGQCLVGVMAVSYSVIIGGKRKTAGDQSILVRLGRLPSLFPFHLTLYDMEALDEACLGVNIIDPHLKITIKVT